MNLTFVHCHETVDSHGFHSAHIEVIAEFHIGLRVMLDGPKVCRQTYLSLEPKRVERKYTFSLSEIRN